MSLSCTPSMGTIKLSHVGSLGCPRRHSGPRVYGPVTRRVI